MILALAGGVGGARLAHGLAQVLAPKDLCIVVNTGDDFEHLGLHISPDPDTVLYTLAGLADPSRGWGLAGESWAFMAALEKLGGETWFALGDKDLATHIERTRRLAEGQTLSAVMLELAARLGVSHRLAPMTDAKVRTIVHTDAGILAFQDYFVRRRCAPAVTKVEYAGAADASPSPAFSDAMTARDLSGIIICPSNPILSIAPILAIAGVREWLEGRNVPCVAVSPIIGGQALKGPAAKIMRELDMPASTKSVADFYTGLIDGIVVDRVDAGEFASAGNPAVLATDALMRDEADRGRLAREVLDFLKTLPAHTTAP